MDVHVIMGLIILIECQFLSYIVNLVGNLQPAVGAYFHRVHIFYRYQLLRFYDMCSVPKYVHCTCD